MHAQLGEDPAHVETHAFARDGEFLGDLLVAQVREQFQHGHFALGEAGCVFLFVGADHLQQVAGSLLALAVRLGFEPAFEGLADGIALAQDRAGIVGLKVMAQERLEM